MDRVVKRRSSGVWPERGDRVLKMWRWNWILPSPRLRARLRGKMPRQNDRPQDKQWSHHLTCLLAKETWYVLSLPSAHFISSPPDVNICTQAAMCCQTGMDDYGWIAAAVGWSLWFLTLILLCVDKAMKLRPDEPKYLVAWSRTSQ